MTGILPPRELQKLLDTAQSSYQRALRLRQSGDAPAARLALLEAAEALFVAAQSSRGALKESRARLAQQLLDEAEALKHQRAVQLKPASGDGSRKGPSTPLSVEDAEQLESWLVQERPSIRFDDIAGLEEVKQQIRLKLLYPFQHPELAEQYGINPGGGILLYGPPGTGKTMIARAVAGEIEAAFFAIKPSEIMSQWVGVAEQNLQKLFAAADVYPVSVVFIDEMESLAPRRRTSHSTVMQRVVPQLLAELDGFEKRKNALLMIGATNEPWSIDSAILRPGRLDRLVYVAPPDAEARQRILELNLKGKPLSPEVSMAELAARTEGFSGADMAALARRACERAFFQALDSEMPHWIGNADFSAELAEMHSSIDPKDLKLFERFAAGKM
jgi:transitional endoplasmic reticulum ATPase